MSERTVVMHPLTRRLAAYARLMRLHRPIGTFLLLWPMLWALWIAAEGFPRLPVLLVFLCWWVVLAL